jgi:translation initiation factor 2B subunit (eIF-2B alpha/beta/delta family)
MADVWATLGGIASDRDSGAAQIARAAAQALGTLTGSDVWAAIRLLLEGHPTMAPLWRLATDILSAADPDQGAEAFLDRLQTDAAAASMLAPALPPWVLTISFSSSVIETVRMARIRLVTCMRSEPGGEGVRMAEGVAPVRARVIEDDEAIKVVPGAAVLVGADAVTPTSLMNKVKTRALAEAAGAKGVPCYAVAGDTKFVDVELPVEQPFERVPLDLFTAIATPDGLLSPSAAAERATQAPIHPGLAGVLSELCM